MQNDNKFLRAKVIYVDHLKIKRLGNYNIFVNNPKRNKKKEFIVLKFVYFKLWFKRRKAKKAIELTLFISQKITMLFKL